MFRTPNAATPPDACSGGVNVKKPPGCCDPWLSEILIQVDGITMSMEAGEQAAQQGIISDRVRAQNPERTGFGSYAEAAACPSLLYHHRFSVSPDGCGAMRTQNVV